MGTPTQTKKILYLAIFCIAILFVYQLVSAEVTIKEDKIYYGNVKEYSSPAQLELNKVLDATKEIQRIKKEKIKSDNPLYWILMQRANEKVQTAIKKIATEKSYDLVGELGYITGFSKPIPDITQSVIDALDQK
ncbi:MAG: hypothetical protein ACE14V_12115 [bacterium]